MSDPRVRPAYWPACRPHNWLPAPFPAHNMLLTACWATDGYTKKGGATLVVPGSANLRRHPNAEETEEKPGAIAIECEPGSVAMWDGNVWHSNWPRTTKGERIVSHITYSRLMMRPVENYSAHADATDQTIRRAHVTVNGARGFAGLPNGVRTIQNCKKPLTTQNVNSE